VRDPSPVDHELLARDEPGLVAREIQVPVRDVDGLARVRGQRCLLDADHLAELLDARQAPTVLDVGCGSAILSILAAGLGASHVVGVDIDATSIEVAKDNLRANDVTEEHIVLSTTPLAKVEGTYDIVVANILAHILLGLRDDLLSHVAPGGDLLLSGIPDFERDRLIEAFTEPGFTLQDHRQSGEWVALHLRREG